MGSIKVFDLRNDPWLEIKDGKVIKIDWNRCEEIAEMTQNNQAAIIATLCIAIRDHVLSMSFPEIKK